MATIDDKDFIDRLIASDGHYEDDPQILEIASYRTPEGKLTWSVAWTIQDCLNLRTSPFVSDIQVIWKRDPAKRECIECGELGDLDQMGCCSVECDQALEARQMPICRACECEFSEDGSCGCNPVDA